jgi:hypothetical protein
MSKNKPRHQAYNIQVDYNILDEAKKLVNVPEAFRNLLEKITKTKTCPCCGAMLKKNGK